VASLLMQRLSSDSNGLVPGLRQPVLGGDVSWRLGRRLGSWTSRRGGFVSKSMSSAVDPGIRGSARE
jgi:hypothetical protein